MKDRQQDIAKTGQWAVEQLAQRLGQQPQQTRDAKYGNGIGLVVDARGAESMPRTLNFFENDQAVTVDTANLHLELFNAAPPRPARDGVFIEDKDQTTRLLFLRNGHIAVEVFPTPDAESLEASAMPATAQDGARLDSSPIAVPGGADDEIRASGEPVAHALSREEVPSPTSKAQRALAAKVAEAREKQKGKEQPTLRVRGNLVRDAVYDAPEKGSPTINLIVGEHVDFEDERVTIYHRAYATNTPRFPDRADKIAGMALRRGEEVTLTGAFQMRPAVRNSKEVVEPRIYIYGIKRAEKREPANEPAQGRQ